MATARKMGIQTVAVYAANEGNPLHRTLADEAWSLGTGTLADTYLNISLIIDIARKSSADAIHPGYGFLAENPDFANACKEQQITFIGPSAEAIRTMGNKLEAARFVGSLGIPLLDVKTGTPEELEEKVDEKDFPLMIKAAAGGGGKGMRIVRQRENLSGALRSTSREAANYFGNPDVYVERYIDRPKHIEIQVLSDHHGNHLHLFERECSIQRRHQKIIEEAPSPTLDDKTREEMGAAAVLIARAIDYSGAGTLEFLVDENRNFFFLEMNTRIQVEHPVTEMTTGIDIVREQILVAGGHALSFSQKDISLQGHAVEARIYAEDPEKEFMPSPGTVGRFTHPDGPGLRTDAGIRSGETITPDYDPMVAKVIAWSRDRRTAIGQLRNALNKTTVTGIRNNKNYLVQALHHPQFIDNEFTTQFIDQNHSDLVEKIHRQRSALDRTGLLAAYIFARTLPQDRQSSDPAWNSIGYWRPHMQWAVEMEDKVDHVHFVRRQNRLTLYLDNGSYHYQLTGHGNDWVTIASETKRITAYHTTDGQYIELSVGGFIFPTRHEGYLDHLKNKALHNGHHKNERAITAPMFGKVLSIEVNEEMSVKKGQTLMILEAMKMENSIQAPQDTIIKHIAVQEGDQVKDGQLLLETT
jgi:3-methylcrotonyl-CoA carboxylase alpha subunit